MTVTDNGIHIPLAEQKEDRKQSSQQMKIDDLSILHLLCPLLQLLIGGGRRLIFAFGIPTLSLLSHCQVELIKHRIAARDIWRRGFEFYGISKLSAKNLV